MSIFLWFQVDALDFRLTAVVVQRRQLTDGAVCILIMLESLYVDWCHRFVPLTAAILIH